MTRAVKNPLIIIFISLLAACSLPRGAALQSEIVNESNAKTPTFAVQPVTRASVGYLSKWPATGWHGHFHWLKAGRGSNSSVIQAGDVINLTIWDSQSNSLLTPTTAKNVQMSELKVSPSGTIFVPYVDEVVVKGLTPDKARERIQYELEPIAPSAQVQLAFAAGQSNSVDLVAGVAKPGTYPLPDRNYSILSLIAQGGGVSDNLRNPIVRLIRSGKTYETPASDLFSDASRNVVLRGNDKVIVENDNRYFVALGATGSEQIVNFEKSSTNALEALSMIGGITDNRADPKGVLILREYPSSALSAGAAGPTHRQVVFTLDLTTADGLFAARNFEINPKDTVLATESPIRAAQTILNLFGTALGLSSQLERI